MASSPFIFQKPNVDAWEDADIHPSNPTDIQFI